MKINGNVLTESGVVKTQARKVLADYVNNHREIFNQATKNENGTYSLQVKDENNNVIYINFEVTVSTLCASDRAKRKSRAKKETVANDYEIE